MKHKPRPDCPECKGTGVVTFLVRTEVETYKETADCDQCYWRMIDEEKKK
jgi:hypothetical protein